MKPTKRMQGFAGAGILWLIIGFALLWWAYTNNWAGMALIAGIVGGLLLLHGLYKIFAPSAGDAGTAVGGAAGSGASGVAGAGAAAAAVAAAGASAVGDAAKSGVDAVGTAAQSGVDAVSAAVQSGADTVSEAAQSGVDAVSDAVQSGADAVSGVVVAGASAVAAGTGSLIAGFVRSSNLDDYRAAYPSNFTGGAPTCVNCGNTRVQAGTCQCCGADLFGA